MVYGAPILALVFVGSWAAFRTGSRKALQCSVATRSVKSSVPKGLVCGMGMRRTRREVSTMIQHIATVAVYVDDPEKALRFRCERVGFQVKREESMGPAGFWLEH